MKFIRKTVIWLLHVGSWATSLYLFAVGNIWGGFGTLAVGAVMGFVYLLVFGIYAADAIKAAEEGREKARKEAHDAEKRRLRGVS